MTAPARRPELQTPDEAQALLDVIRAGHRPAWVAMTAAHEWAADLVLGYASWADMVHAELDVTVRHADRMTTSN